MKKLGLVFALLSTLTFMSLSGCSALLGGSFNMETRETRAENGRATVKTSRTQMNNGGFKSESNKSSFSF